MTVEELIAELQKLPKDSLVLLTNPVSSNMVDVLEVKPTKAWMNVGDHFMNTKHQQYQPNTCIYSGAELKNVVALIGDDIIDIENCY